jgi:pyrroloquinoline quinone biosynthesis protein D
MEITDETRPRLARGVRLQVDRTSGKSVLLFPEGILELNETAQAILTRCDGKTIGEIKNALATEYEIDLAVIGRDLCEAFSDLVRRKLLDLE